MSEQLSEGKKYYLYEKPLNGPICIYRATYLATYRNHACSYLIKRRYDDIMNQTVIVYTPLNWFIKAECLDDILSKTCLPTDVINIIDGYLS
jgi:hypothetical protein